MPEPIRVAVVGGRLQLVEAPELALLTAQVQAQLVAHEAFRRGVRRRPGLPAELLLILGTRYGAGRAVYRPVRPRTDEAFVGAWECERVA